MFGNFMKNYKNAKKGEVVSEEEDVHRNINMQQDANVTYLEKKMIRL